MQGGKLPAQVPRHEGKPSDWTDTTKAMKFGTVMGGGGGAPHPIPNPNPNPNPIPNPDPNPNPNPIPNP